MLIFGKHRKMNSYSASVILFMHAAENLCFAQNNKDNEIELSCLRFAALFIRLRVSAFCVRNRGVEINSSVKLCVP